MLVLAPHFPCALLLWALLWRSEASLRTPECEPRPMPDVKIDIKVAVAKGARFTDPINAASAEECVSACCSEWNIQGDRACNLAVYDSRKSNSLQNCYRFLCPEPEACPMSPAPGVLSYQLWTENSNTEKSDSDDDRDVVKIPKSKDSKKVPSSSSKKSESVAPPAVSEESESEWESNQPSVEQRPASAVHPQSKADDGQHPDKEGGGADPPNKVQSASGKKPSLSLHAADSAEPESVQTPHDPAEKKSHPESKMAKEKEANTPDQITSQLLHLAKDIDQQLEKIATPPKKGKGSGDETLDSLDGEAEVEPTKSSLPKDAKKLPERKQSIEKKPESLEVPRPTPPTAVTSLRTSPKVTPLAAHPNPTTSTTTSKDSKVHAKVPSSETKNAKVASSHHSANASSKDAVVKTITPVPATSRTSLQPKSAVQPSRTPSAKGAKSALQEEADDSFITKDMREAERSQQDISAPAANLDEVPENLGTSLANSDKSGLVAALIFGVMFLVVIIGLVSRKVTEARRRHQYTKLDYLINGMYVDT